MRGDARGPPVALLGGGISFEVDRANVEQDHQGTVYFNLRTAIPGFLTSDTVFEYEARCTTSELRVSGAEHGPADSDVRQVLPTGSAWRLAPNEVARALLAYVCQG